LRSPSEPARVLVLGVVVPALAGCLKFSNDGLACGLGDSCPPGFHCASDKRCWKMGQDPSGSRDQGAGGGDLGGADLSAVASGDLAGTSPGADLAATLGLGQLCMGASDCISHNCVDGVCCDLPCAGSCSSCNQASSLGHCAPLPPGNTPSHGTCGPDPMASCGRNGKCDGAGSCAKWDATVTCGKGSCSNGMSSAASRCDGNGNCTAATPTPCDPYVCQPDGSACYTTCTAGSIECLSPHTCSGGSCGPRSNGQPCAVATQATDCKTGNCVDNVCCDKPQSMCTGCQACNLGTPGTCANVTSGDPHGVCPTNASNCQGGGCSNGSCAAASASTTCAQSCMSTNMLSVSKCNGTSTGCPAAGAPTPCAGDLICADNMSCKQSCGGDGDCISTDWCNNNNCAAKKDDGVGCGAAHECKSNVCTYFALDADGDGYGSPTAGSKFCGTTAPAGYTTDQSDCCDIANSASAKATHPGQSGWFTSANDCGNYDYNCFNGGELEYTTTGSCTQSGQCNFTETYQCDTANGWVGSIPGCGATGTWLKSCGAICCSHTCEGGGACCGGACNSMTNVNMSQQQGCH
jgi:hypothetical protein